MVFIEPINLAGNLVALEPLRLVHHDALADAAPHLHLARWDTSC